MAEIERIFFAQPQDIGRADANRYVTEVAPKDVRELGVDWEKQRIIVMPQLPPGRVVLIPMGRVAAIIMREDAAPAAHAQGAASGKR